MIDDFDIDVLTMTSAAILIVKLNGSNWKQLSGKMQPILEQKQVYGIVMGEDVRPVYLAEDATALEQLVHSAAVIDCVKHHCATRSTILLGIDPWLQALYM